MTQTHPPFEQLSELVDGDLTPEATQALERHLTACEACRAQLSRLRAVLDRAAALPASIEPPKEAWQTVRARLRASSSPARTRLSLRQWGMRAAAAVVLVVASSAVTVLVLRRDSSPGDEMILTRGPAAAIPAAVHAVERSYADVVDELTATVEAQRQTLSPEAIAILERTLRVVDEAIAEARAALAADPGNNALVDVLSANYEHKVQLLRRASELRART